MAKLVENAYTGTDSLTADQIRRALSGDYEGFKYYFEKFTYFLRYIFGSINFMTIQ